MTPTAKLFTNGRSQAVRLPKGFRFEGVKEVTLEREGNAVILRPLAQRSVEHLIASLARFQGMPDREQPSAADIRQPLGG